MYCVHCGTALPEQANFCLRCGAAQEIPVSRRVCTVIFRQVGEKWSLFGKEICRFEAVAEDGEVIAASATITLTGFEMGLPNERNKKHKTAFDGLVKKLIAEGWTISGESGKQWYGLNFYK